MQEKSTKGKVWKKGREKQEQGVGVEGSQFKICQINLPDTAVRGDTVRSCGRGLRGNICIIFSQT